MMANFDKCTCVAVIRNELERHHAADGAFKQLRANYERIDHIYDILSKNDLLHLIKYMKDEKNSDISKKMRMEGNEAFRVKNLKKAYELYTESLGYADGGSEDAALAHANRSAVLFELELYDDCLKDIESALMAAYPCKLIEKLEERRRRTLEKHSITTYHHIISVPKLLNPHPSIESASDCVEIREIDGRGRCIVANRNIAPGEIIAVEKSYVNVLVDNLNTHCHYCLKQSYSVLSCAHCTQAFYCTVACRDAAYASYHRYECALTLTLRHSNFDKLVILALRIVLKPKYHTETSNQIYQSQNYEEINELITNEEKRGPKDLWNRSIIGAILYYLMKNYTDYFDSNNEVEFKNLLMQHLQTGPCNFHQIHELSAEGELEELAGGVYAFHSLLNHSCDPNVNRDCYGDVLVLRAIGPIKRNEECLDNYGYHYAVHPKNDRLEALERQYFFRCNCKPCTINWPLYQNLPEYETDVEFLEDEDMDKLCKGNVRNVDGIMKKAIVALEKLNDCRPCKIFNNWQEVLKRCYALNANRITVKL